MPTQNQKIDTDGRSHAQPAGSESGTIYNSLPHQQGRVDGPHRESEPKSLSKKDAVIRGTPLAASGRGRISSCLGFKVASTGFYVPQEIVTNKDLERLGCDSDWIVQRTGMLERRRAAENEACSDMAYQAAIDCLQRANVPPHEVDLIIVATITPDHATPSTACILQNKLGCIAPAFDLNAACSGFVYAMSVAAQFVSNGTARNALVIGADVMSRMIDPNDVKTYPLFGDGAGAVLLQPDDIEAEQQSGLVAYSLGAEGDGGPQLVVPCGGSREPLTPEAIACGGQFLKMDGRSVFKWAVRVIRESCQDVLTHSGLQVEDIAAWVLHQANTRIIDAAVEDFKIDRQRLVINVDRLGNTSGASVALALHDGVLANKIQRNDYVILCGFGAGLTWGTAIMRW